MESPAGGHPGQDIWSSADIEVPVLTPVAIITEPGEETVRRICPWPRPLKPAASKKPPWRRKPLLRQLNRTPAASAQKPQLSGNGKVPRIVPAAQQSWPGTRIWTSAAHYAVPAPMGSSCCRDVEAAAGRRTCRRPPPRKRRPRLSTLARQLAEEKGQDISAWIGLRGPVFGAVSCARRSWPRAAGRVRQPWRREARSGQPMSTMRQALLPGACRKAVFTAHRTFTSSPTWIMDPAPGL